LTISDDTNIQIINQEYRDALMRISAIEYNSGDTKDTHRNMRAYAVRALEVPKEVYAENAK